MKIMYTISSTGHGNGGHFYDLKSIANEIANNNSVLVVNIGKKISKVLVNQKFKVHFLRYKGYNFLNVFIELNKLVSDFKPEIINSFDVYSFNFSRYFSWKLNQPTYLTKCGGPNPLKYYPIPDNLILVSFENKLFFQNKNHKYKSNIFMIPQRVEPVILDHVRINLLREKHQLNGEIILRVNRISKHYHKTMIQSLNLLKYLLKFKNNVKLLLIGSIQDETVFNEINQYIDKNDLRQNVIVETDQIFTKNASELLSIGDLIIGTGRNFMEACSINKPMLVPYKNGEYPLLVSNNNFFEVKNTNFSPRTIVNHFNYADNLNNILNHKFYSNSRKWYDSNFSVKKGAEKYMKMYNETKSETTKFRFFDFLLNTIYSIRNFLIK